MRAFHSGSQVTDCYANNHPTEHLHYPTSSSMTSLPSSFDSVLIYVFLFFSLLNSITTTPITTTTRITAVTGTTTTTTIRSRDDLAAFES